MLPKEWLFIIPDTNNQYILYAPLQRTAFRITPLAAENILPILDGYSPSDTLQLEIQRLLADHNLLVLPSHARMPESESNKIFLSITNKCNLRCIYCYASAGTDNTTISFDTAKKVIDHPGQLHSV